MSFTHGLAPCSFFPLCLTSIHTRLLSSSLSPSIFSPFLFTVPPVSCLLPISRSTHSALHSLWISNEVVEYLCFLTLIGSSVLFNNSFSHFVSATVEVEHGNTCDRVTTVTEAAIDHSSDEAQLRKKHWWCHKVGLSESFDDAVAPASRLVCRCIKLLRRQLQHRIWPSITTGVYSPLGPKRKETHGAKYGKRERCVGVWNMHHISEHHLESLLILPYQRHRKQTWILKFMEFTESWELLLAISFTTREIMVYITWMWKYTPSQSPAAPKLNINACWKWVQSLFSASSYPGDQIPILPPDSSDFGVFVASFFFHRWNIKSNVWSALANTQTEFPYGANVW